MTLEKILDSLGCPDSIIDRGTAIKAMQILQDEIYSTRNIVSKVDMENRKLIHSKIQLIKKCILNNEINEEVYEVINNLCAEISRDICPWIKY